MANKRINDMQARSDFDETCNVPVDDAAQSWRVTGAQMKTFMQAGIAPLTTLGDILFAAASGVPTRLAGNTTTTKQVLVQTGTGSASAAPAWQDFKPPTIQKFTSSSGTYTKPAGVSHIRVRAVGGGGGGSGSGSGASAGTGGTGGTTTFGTSLISCLGGLGGSLYSSGLGAATPTINSPCIGTAIAGSYGQSSGLANGGGYPGGGSGGPSPFGGVGGAPGGNGAGWAAVANSGSGGGGGNTAVNGHINGAGGGSGGFVDCIIPNPDATYAYAVGAAGTAGTAGTAGYAGGAGGSGYIEVTEYYQ